MEAVAANVAASTPGSRGGSTYVSAGAAKRTAIRVSRTGSGWGGFL